MDEAFRNNVKAVFATPIGTFSLIGLETLNATLLQTFLERETEQYRNEHPSQQIQNEVFESQFDLFNWASPAIQQLRTVILRYVSEMVALVNDYDDDALKSLDIFNDAWFHITRRGGYVQPHNHPNASWSAVYCVEPGEKDPGHEDSGALVMHNPRAGGAMYSDPGNMNLMPRFSHDAIKLHLKAGDLIIFPSDLVHSVSPYLGPKTRVTVAANFWLRPTT